MSTQRLQRIKLILLAMVGIVTAGVVYAADVTELVAHAVVIDTTIDVGSIITFIAVVGGGISVWVKMNRSDANQDAKLENMTTSLVDLRNDHNDLRRLVNEILLMERRGG